MDEAIKAGSLSGLHDVTGLYKDDYHMNNIGQFLAAATVYAVLEKSNPTGINIPSWMFGEGNGPALTLSLAQQIEGIVWGVVSADSRAGIAPVPIPSAAWLFACALAFVGRVGLRSKE